MNPLYWPPVDIEEDVPVIDVHPPHEPIHCWRDFFLHLTTITIGLLIALSLEGLVEWHHHRALAHEAQVSLHREIAKNESSIHEVIDDNQKRQSNLKQDVVILKYIVKYHKDPENQKMSIGSRVIGLESVAWQTAQSTGALSYMPYALAQEYTDLYDIQTLLRGLQLQSNRDVIIAIGPLANEAKDEIPTQAEAEFALQNLQTLQGQLWLEGSAMNTLGYSYKKFLAAHPD
jgi:hypothetical protein